MISDILQFPGTARRTMPVAATETPPAGAYSLEVGEHGQTVLQPLRGALKREDAAAYLGCSSTQLWKLVSLGEIGRTPFGTYPIAELDRYIQEHTERVEQ